MGHQLRSWCVVAVVMVAGLGAAACVSSNSGSPSAPPVLTLTVPEKTVAHGDTIKGTAVAEESCCLVHLDVVVADSDTTSVLVTGDAANAGRLSATFAYVPVKEPVGSFVVLKATTFNFVGDTVRAFDSVRVTP